MTLDDMCIMAARYSDRYDEFEKTPNPETGKQEYSEDALHYFNVFRDAINEAYFDVARSRCEPDVYTDMQVGDDGTIDLSYITPLPYAVKNVLNTQHTMAIAFNYETKFVLHVVGAKPGDTVSLYYSYMPERLEGYNDEPIFPESVVDPMVYVSLAVARMWLSEKKASLYAEWMQNYYSALKGVRPTMRGGNLRRMPRRLFR